jgi:hypothetical protein
MLRDNPEGSSSRWLSSAGGPSPALHVDGRKSSDDRPSCLENPRPAGAESTLTENASSPFHAEPRHVPSGIRRRRLKWWTALVRRTMNRPNPFFLQMCVKPRKSNVSGLPSPLRSRFCSANRPNSIRRVLSGWSSSPNVPSRSRKFFEETICFCLILES